ncbi:hypothetical protein Klosneuvirus_1_180 [Klosneuvirus KNV1]|uniref:Minor capsid protein P11 C-terminal conserved region domain-containing protein n=1 Tax=Klosneuvirus KNV1 TaxID=1977640 RepID=A0A1V0SHY7_9VIRU|nr:hypothetical protein Klosneuvirus_1_180 [Klosneuvirus KNV1]
MLNTQTKILLLVFAGLVLVYLLYNGNSSSTVSGNKDEQYNQLPQNMEPYTNPQIEPMDNISEQQVNKDLEEGKIVPIPREKSIDYFPQRDYAPPTPSDWLKYKFNGRNKAKEGEYKKVSFAGGARGDLGPADWDAYFDHNNNVIGNAQVGGDDKFLPMDESSDKLAIFKTKGQATCGSNQNCEPEDLFDVDKYLPQEVNDDWFEVMNEPISVKNRHLINITKPIGINTIGTSLKNANYDLRAAPACPKMIVSPWLQSSIEPDVNLKPLF